MRVAFSSVPPVVMSALQLPFVWIGVSGAPQAGLLTQPQPGVFDAFVARCTHAGCVLPGVEGDVIKCPCHGSQFALNGTVVRGPAMEPLVPVKVTVAGGLIVAG